MAKKKKKIHISKSTVVIIIVLIVAFAGWYMFLYKSLETQINTKNVNLPVIKRGNIELINEQIENRKLDVPPLTPSPADIGKDNIFE